MRSLWWKALAALCLVALLGVAAHAHGGEAIGSGAVARAAEGACQCCAVLHGASEPPALLALPAPPAARLPGADSIEAHPVPPAPAGLPAPRGPPVTPA